MFFRLLFRAVQSLSQVSAGRLLGKARSDLSSSTDTSELDAIAEKARALLRRTTSVDLGSVWGALKGGRI